MRSNFAAVLVILAKEATVTDGKSARPTSTEEEPVKGSIAESPDQRPVNAPSSVTQDLAPAPVCGRLAALIQTAAAGSQLAAAAQSMAGRCGLDAVECRPVAAVLAALLAFKLLGLLCRSELIAALTVPSAAFLYFTQQPRRQPEKVSFARFILIWASLVRASIVGPSQTTLRIKPSGQDSSA